ncbi:hypothetical protein GNY06_01895 [Elizabethkingia argentiflava]|uniref:Outer membrane protein beta-barrel domain-containing protein n=1 Tax=Elizabethkingia argenteiflava TaxID=2681556 RepID=A0A845PVQ3_9FLAO|nr:hypothetical protein [Elizabethkingia argenteiflava]NAW50190.1 hypothetical protein [Elizabethkingia argenteiflava]
MKVMKQIALAVGIFATGALSAQSANMRNMLKIGVNGGASTGGNTSASVGADIAYQNLLIPGFGLGVATGYNEFFGKNKTIGGKEIKYNDFGMIPVAALLRYYPAKLGFYGGVDLGYGFIVGKNEVAKEMENAPETPNGGFYFKPEIGYHNRDWNFFVRYTKVFTGSKGQVGDVKFNVGSVGAGVAYNIPLGK